MRATQIERAKRPVRRSNAVALGLSSVGPSNLWAEPAGLTVGELVRIPEREVDLEAAQQPHDARAAARFQAKGFRTLESGCCFGRSVGSFHWPRQARNVSDHSSARSRTTLSPSRYTSRRPRAG